VFDDSVTLLLFLAPCDARALPCNSMIPGVRGWAIKATRRRAMNHLIENISYFQASWLVDNVKVGYCILYQSLCSFIPWLDDCIICLRKPIQGQHKVKLANATDFSNLRDDTRQHLGWSRFPSILRRRNGETCEDTCNDSIKGIKCKISSRTNPYM